MGSLFPGKVQSLLNERCTKSGSQCTEDSNHEHPKPRAQEPLSGGGWGGGAVSIDECFPHLRARVNWKPEQTRFPQTQAHCWDPFSLEYQAQWKPCPTSDGATTLTQRRNSKERNTTGETEKVGKEPWDVQFSQKREREGNSKGIQEMSSPQPRKVCGEDASSVRSVCFPI